MASMMGFSGFGRFALGSAFLFSHGGFACCDISQSP